MHSKTRKMEPGNKNRPARRISRLYTIVDTLRVLFRRIVRKNKRAEEPAVYAEPADIALDIEKPIDKPAQNAILLTGPLQLPTLDVPKQNPVDTQARLALLSLDHTRHLPN